MPARSHSSSASYRQSKKRYRNGTTALQRLCCFFSPTS
jgi:hypothetical protein